MSDLKTISAAIVKSVAEVLTELNLPAQKFCQELGINMATLESPHGRVPENAFGGLMHKARLHSSRQNLGLLIGERLLPSSLGRYGFSLMTAENIDKLANRSKKHQSHLTHSLNIETKQVAANYIVSLDIKVPHSETNDFIMDFSMANVCHNIRWILGNNRFQPVACYFTRSVPDNVEDYKQFFNCPVYFNQDSNTIAVSIQDFHRKSPSRNKQLDEANEHELQRIVSYSNDQKLVQKIVEEQIIKLLPTGDISMETVARNFSISDRTLLRRLKAEGCTYLELLDQTRKSIAKHYVEKTESSFQEITFMLGFKDSSTFYRAFKRWYDQTPSQFKQQKATTAPVLPSALEPAILAQMHATIV